MTTPVEMLQKAVQEARAGRRIEARDLLLELVEIEPHNEMAWMWLSGLVDSLEDRIIACENVLTINPGNEKVRAYLADLQRQQHADLVEKNNEEAAALLKEAKGCAERDETGRALELARQAVERREDYEQAWLFIGRISPDIDQQIEALQRAYQLNPSNTKTIAALKQARYRKSDPLGAAQLLEQQGKYAEAAEAYKLLAGKTRDSRQFDYIYRQITRLEGLQNEKIRHVAPALSIARLTFAWPVLYLSLALLQMGFNPFRHPALYSCLGLPMVLLGAFLLALAEVRTRHIVWQKIFSEHGDGSNLARMAAATAGWILVIIPHAVLLIDSLNRLRLLQIPPNPF